MRSILTAILSMFFAFPLLTAWMAQPNIIRVAADGDFQAALNLAQPGDVVELPAGARYTGNFLVPVKTGTSFITIRSSRCNEIPVGVRITPEQVSQVATLATPNVGPVLKAPVFNHNYRFECIQFTQSETLPIDPTVGFAWSYNLIELGDGDISGPQKTFESVPHDFAFDRVIIRPREGGMTQRGITLNAAAVSVTNSYIPDIKWPGVETHALGGWNGPGPFTIENNYLEAASINILFGGAATAIPNLIPSDITIRRNTLTKRLEWQGKGLVVKNCLEVKNGRRITITDNVCTNSWPDAQTGWAVILNALRDSPQATVEDVEIARNVFRDVANGINVRGMEGDDTVTRTHRISIHDNVIENIGAFNGEGKAFQVLNGSESISIDHNTVKGNVTRALLLQSLDTVKHVGLRFTNNLLPHGDYGIFGDGGFFGTAALDKYASGWTCAGSALYAKPQDPAASLYPAGNFFPATELAAIGLLGTDGLPVGARSAVTAPSPTPTPTATPTPLPSPSPSPSATLTPLPSPTPNKKPCKLWPPNKWFSCL